LSPSKKNEKPSTALNEISRYRGKRKGQKTDSFTGCERDHQNRESPQGDTQEGGSRGTIKGGESQTPGVVKGTKP